MAATTLTLKQFQDILRNVTNNSCDEDTIDYMAGMLHEENSSILNSETIAELIGPFLSDGGVCRTEADISHVSDRIISLLHSADSNCGKRTDSQTDSIVTENTENSTNTILKTPFNVENFLNDTQSGYHDPYLGLKKVNVNFNSSIPISEALKLESVVQKERAKQLKLMREWERAKAPLPAPIKINGTRQLGKITDILVNSFSVIVGGRELLKDASLKIIIGRKYGLIGRNGVGKSTFIGGLVRHEFPGIQKDLNIGCVEQEISESDLEQRTIDAVLSVHVERTELLKQEKLLLSKPQTEETGARLVTIYQRMEEIDMNAAEPEAASILYGLGFSLEMQKQKIKELSGGWRMRVALARALFATPDILCLDEPTNHLDLHAVAWLTDHLLNSTTTCIIVSHARTFLNDVCTDIIEFKDQQLKYYRGDYDTFERVKTESERLQQRQFDAQQMKREHAQKFIDRFRYKASRAALVQSRIKALEKLPMLEAVANDPALTFQFGIPEDIATPVLQLSGCWFTYKGNGNAVVNNDDWILKDVDLSVDLQSRIAICGVNGCGKSTLLKMLSGASEPNKGLYRRANKLRIGFFSQYHVEQLDLTLNSVQQLQVKFSEDCLKDEDARAYLGRFGISGLLALEPLYVLSGGQKSRVAIAMMAYKNPHILILDEPTNHLDLDAVQALIAALNQFQGGIVVVSHDMHLLSCVADEIYHVDTANRKVIQYRSDIENYRNDLLKKLI